MKKATVRFARMTESILRTETAAVAAAAITATLLQTS
jgi:16S rRNA U1498 N3-methylase RsmE